MDGCESISSCAYDIPSVGASIRTCLRAPPPEAADAARYLDAAVSAHLAGDFDLADVLIRAADIPALYAHLKHAWSDGGAHLHRTGARQPTFAQKRQVHERDGHNCRFCEMPVVRPEIQRSIASAYPSALRWGDERLEQHYAFQVMCAHYDHVVPLQLGGSNDADNIVLACTACCAGRGGRSLRELGIEDPRHRPVVRREWDGLERFTP